MQISKTDDPIYAHLNDDTDKLLSGFIKEINDKHLSPFDVIKKYNQYFDEINKQFKKYILKNENAKSGLYISRYKNYRIEDYIKDKFGFSKTRRNLYMRYDKVKFIDLVLFEITLLLRKYNYLYPFMIRYAIYRVLTLHFIIYENSGSWYKVIMYSGDINDAYARVIDTNIDDLPTLDAELNIALFWKRNEKQKTPVEVIDINKPRKAEDLTVLFKDRDDLTQKQKYKIIAEHYGVSTRTATRWMAQFGLSKNLHNAKSVVIEKPKEEPKKEETVDVTELLKRLEFFEKHVSSLNSLIENQAKTIENLENENKQLKEENKQLKENQNGGLFGLNGLD